MSAPPRPSSPDTPSLAGLWYLLPLFFVAHAVVFWGRGILDEEGMMYIQKYLADRSLLATIFDPNDTTLYQARELSYLVDVFDARVLAWLASHGAVLFIPASGAIGLLAAAIIYLRGARKTFHFPALTSSLLLTLFLSCIVTQASTAIFYRSSKIVLTVALFAFLFYLASVFRRAESDRPVSVRQLAVVFVLGLVMSLSDRQGFFYLLTTTSVIGLLWLAALARRDPHASTRFRLGIACASAVLAAGVYSFVIAPRIIAWTGGASVSFQHQEQSFADFNWTLVSFGFEIFKGQVQYLFGNVPFFALAAAGIVAALFAMWRRRSPAVTELITGAVVVSAALVVMLAFMVLYHRPIYTIPDHTLWYYTLTVGAVLIFGLTLIVANIDLARAPLARHAVHAVLLLMIASNVLHYHAQKRLMIGSRYFSEQYARTRQVLANDDHARGGLNEPGERPWLRVDPDGAVVTLPVEDEAFPREVQAAFATYRHVPPLDNAPGPYWARLYEFLSNSPELFQDPAELSALVDGLRSVGVRHIELLPDGDAGSRPTPDALRASGQIAGETTRDRAIVFDLGAPAARVATGPLRQIPASALHLTASADPDGINRAADGNPATFWSTNAPQSGQEWIRIDFDHPVDVGAVQLLFVAGNPGRNPVQSGTARPTGRAAIFKEAFRPRGLTIDVIADDQRSATASFNPLGALIQALLKNPVQPVMEFRLPPNRSRVLVLRQTGRSAHDPWNVAELTIWTRQ